MKARDFTTAGTVGSAKASIAHIVSGYSKVSTTFLGLFVVTLNPCILQHGQSAAFP